MLEGEDGRFHIECADFGAIRPYRNCFCGAYGYCDGADHNGDDERTGNDDGKIIGFCEGDGDSVNDTKL